MKKQSDVNGKLKRDVEFIAFNTKPYEKCKYKFYDGEKQD